jgi:hypothetical protein
MFLNDRETDTDLLYYEAIAATVVQLIGQAKTSSVTIGIHGDWGAGKSSVLKMLAAAYKDHKKVACLTFNGWTFEGFDDAKTVLLETIVEELRRLRPTSAKVKEAAKKAFQRIDWLKLARKTGSLALTAVTGIPSLDQVRGLFDLASNLVKYPLGQISGADVKAIVSKAGDFIKDAPEGHDHIAKHMHGFRDDFKALLDAADIDQLIVIVDDLDRCLPETAIATLEAMRLFFDMGQTVFVIGADELMIEYAVKRHFPELPQTTGPLTYARNYLEKLIQVPFRIPALGIAETRAYITLLLAEDALGKDDAGFQALLQVAREDMRKPWISRGLDQSLINQAFGGAIPQRVQEAMIIAAQVTPILSEGTRGNPRQIKRFLNSLMLRHAIADARGFGEDIARPVLAKIMLAERFHPEFYEELSRRTADHATGKPAELAALEASARSDADPSREPQPGRTSRIPDADATTWDQNEWARRWGKIDPALAEIDLRPYVFVTRDKRGALGGLAVANHLEAIVEKLMGPKMTIQASLEELRKLNTSDAPLVFDGVAARMRHEDKWSTKPQGLDGLLALVGAHPALEQQFVSLMQSLPTKRLGTWAASNLAGTIKDPSLQANAKALLREWAEQTENAKLAGSAKNTMALYAKVGHGNV